MEVIQKSSSCAQSDVRQGFQEKKAYSAAIDLTQDEDDDTEEDEVEEPTPQASKGR